MTVSTLETERKPALTPKVALEGLGGAGLIALTVLLARAVRRLYRRWGATQAEAEATLPGDELVRSPKSQITLAVTIQAPPERVWPLFVQLGCQRGGWYSYDLLDNGGVPSAEGILPEHQDLQVGDQVNAMPKGDFGFPVAALEPGRRLTLAGTLNTRTGKPADPDDPGLDRYFSGDLTFRLEPLPGGATRMVFRQRLDWDASRMNNLIYRGLIEPVSFVMTRKTLLNVKRLAESERIS